MARALEWGWDHHEMADLIAKSGILTVNLTGIYGDQGLPSIWNDHEAIGQLAAEHLHSTFNVDSKNLPSANLQTIIGLKLDTADFKITCVHTTPISCFTVPTGHIARQTGCEAQQAEIRNVQIKRAQQPLRETQLPLSQIASLTGFKHAEYFSVVFKHELGQTPGQYRSHVP